MRSPGVRAFAQLDLNPFGKRKAFYFSKTAQARALCQAKTARTAVSTIVREARLVKYENLMQCLKSILLQFRIGRFPGAPGAPAHGATRRKGREEAAEVQCGLLWNSKRKM